jgi:single-strand DNA-binding protein
MIANHRDFNGDNKRTYWIPVTVWGAKAENLMKYVKKGTKVSVVGELEIRSWQDDSGEWQKAVTVNAREVNFFNKRDNGEDTEETVEEPKAKEEAKAAADDLDEFEWD